MAQTNKKSSASRQSGGSTKSTKSRSSAKSGRTSKSAASTRRTAASTRRTPSATRRTNRSGSSSGGNGSAPKQSGSGSGSPVTAARDTVVEGAQSVGHAVGSAASSAKVPAVAGGAALAGLVGGVALSRRPKRRLLGVPLPGTARPLVKINGRGSGTKDLIKAAGHTGRQMAELAVEVRQARQQLSTGRQRSPIEVVLEGLTSRGRRDPTK